MSAEMLFDVPESLSPRVRWMRRLGVRVAPADKGVMAWAADNHEPSLIGGVGRPFDDREVGRGATEIEAVEDLAMRLGVVAWGESTEEK